MIKQITAALTAMLMLPAISAPAVSGADRNPASVQAGEPADVHEIALETGRAKWYNIGETGGMSVPFDIPEKAAVHVYDKYDRPVYASYMKGRGNSVTLPESGRIVFVGESGEAVRIG